MDDQNKQPMLNTVQPEVTPSPIVENVVEKKENPHKKVIFMILGLMVIAELIWAGWTVLKPAPIPQPVVIEETPVLVDFNRKASITLAVAIPVVKVKDSFDVQVSVNATSETDGLDVILKYDPQLLTVEASGTAKQPVQVTSLYDEYPVNKVDEKAGLITLSGISTKNDGIMPNGLLGTIKFTAKAVGTTEIKLNYSANQSTDSNVTAHGDGQDILDQPNDLTIDISP